MPSTIAIVGRPNVGKSSLLNMLARRKVSIVDPTEGVTRDRVATLCELPPESEQGQPRLVEVHDTGGYGVHDALDLTAEIERQITAAVAEADLILFVVDAQAGPLPLDQTVAQLLRTTAGEERPVLLVANKVDADKHEPGAWELLELGFGEPVMISATTGHNKHALYEKLRAKLPPETDGPAAPDPGLKLALVGKRNAGKSTMVNALAGQERVIVSEHEGTTRDSVDVRFEVGEKVYTAIDTAGVRKRKSLAGDIEFYAYHRSLRAIRRADVCLLLLDASVAVSPVDRQLAHEILKHYRPTVIVLNKWDLAEEGYSQEQYVEYLDQALKGLHFAPIAFVNSVAGEGLTEVLEMAEHLHEQANIRVPTAELNEVIEQITAERGPRAKGGKPAKIFYATQVEVDPPSITLFVNDPDLFDDTYQRFLLNRFHDLLPFSEVPIRLNIRGKQRER